MDKLYYKLDFRDVFIHSPVDGSKDYLVESFGIPLGHIYIKSINELTGTPEWESSNNFLDAYKTELGAFIMRSGL